MRMKLVAPIAALAIAGAAAGPPAYAAAAVTSTFDTGTDGWTFGTYNGVTGQPVTWDPATQSITKTHGFGDGGFQAPSAYIGDKSDYLGGTFSFDLSATAVSDSYATRPALVLIGKDNQVLVARSVGAPMTTLRHFEVVLQASHFYKGSPTGMTTGVGTAEFAAILADLRGVHIWADWNPNVETERLDNVVMKAGVPEPATWALRILGFGAAGSALRRRRVATVA